jgi:hypothetical protein
MEQRLVPSGQVDRADWLRDRLAGFGGRVDQVVPGGFAAYARILHRADHGAASWADVARVAGTTLHPTAQFSALAGRWEYDARAPVGWPGENPDTGTLDVRHVRVLTDILAGHTTTPEACWLAVWEGYGQLPTAWQRLPRAVQPHRAYYLFERPLAEVDSFSVRIDTLWRSDPRASQGMAVIGASHDSGRPAFDQVARPAEPAVQTPNKWWPADHAWCISSEIDFDSTLVGGSEALVAEVLAHPDLEAFRVLPSDDLTLHGDHINPLPARRT